MQLLRPPGAASTGRRHVVEKDAKGALLTSVDEASATLETAPGYEHTADTTEAEHARAAQSSAVLEAVACAPGNTVSFW